MTKPTLVTAFLAFLGAAPALHAEPNTRAPEQVEQAEQRFHVGTEAFEAGRYADAYGALRSAWDLAPGYRTAAGLGQVELHLGQYRDAAEHLLYCLRSFPADGDAVVRKHVEDGLEQAREHVTALRVRVDVEGATVSVDGVPVGRAPLGGLVFVNPGSHVVEASAAGHAKAEESFDASVRATRDLVLSLGPSLPDPGPPAGQDGRLGASASPRQPSGDAPRPPRTGLSSSVWALVIGGSLTAVATGVAVVFAAKGASAKSDVEDLHRRIAESGDCSSSATAQISLCAKLRDTADERNRDNRIATFSGVSAAALAVTTAGVALALSPRAEPRDRTGSLTLRVAPGPGGAVLSVGGAL